MGPAYKRTILISLAGHLAMFGLLGFSFGAKVPFAGNTDMRFIGQILTSQDLIARKSFSPSYIGGDYLKGRISQQIGRINKEKHPVSDKRLKPAAGFSLVSEKQVFIPWSEALNIKRTRQDSRVVLHPELPYHFLLYFRDRESVHIQLEFKAISPERTDHPVIRRKISSGSLEADLLAMRYIGHYLSTQGRKIPVDEWQVVKIDLSANND
ncbi:hypothetical protein ACFLZ3_00085 [Candidatus Omnitrophota bacterium]